MLGLVGNIFLFEDEIPAITAISAAVCHHHPSLPALVRRVRQAVGSASTVDAGDDLRYSHGSRVGSAACVSLRGLSEVEGW